MKLKRRTILAALILLTAANLSAQAQQFENNEPASATQGQKAPAGGQNRQGRQAAANRSGWGLRPPIGTKVHRDIFYVPGSNNPAQTLDLYVNEKAQGKQRLVVWIHGGAWRSGSKRGGPFAFLLENGYAVASLDYRLSGEAKFPAQIFDCKAAIRWLRAHAGEYHLDAERIGVWGGSAGGHLAALLGTTNADKSLEGEAGNPKYSSSVQAVCDWFGPSNLPEMAQEQQDPGHMSTGDIIVAFLGGPIVEKTDLARQASPLCHVAKSAPPFLIMHGDHDRVVPLSQSQELYAALKKNGVDATLNVVKGAGHGVFSFGVPEREMVLKFFNQHLQNCP